MTLGFIGLGRMGSGMARNLLRAGHSVVVYNRTRSRAEELVPEGARVADDPAAACQADAVLTMLADDAAVEQVTFGERGILGALGAGAVHVSHSTISAVLARRLAAEHASRGQLYVSAPVFGRPVAAASAQLLVVAAGAPATIERLQPVFGAVGHKTVVVGPEAWQANVVKLCGNFMLGSMIEAFGEALATVRRCGVGPDAFVDVMSGLFRSPVYEMYGAIIAGGQFDPAGFALKLGLKDIRLALAVADEAGVPMPFANIVHDALLAALSAGMGELDWSSSTRIAARNAGLEK